MTMTEVDIRPGFWTGDSPPDGGHPDPMSLVGQLPEVSVPIGSLIAAFYLRQAGTDPAHVRLLADAASSVDLPAVLVQKQGWRLIDGMHRLEAAKLRGERSIRARVVDCSDEEALVLAVKSNTLHGLPLARADRISGAKRILSAHPDWSDRVIAGMAGLSARTIASLRNSTIGEAAFIGKRLGRDGKRRPVVSEEGRLRAAEYIRAHPDASLRQVASATDVSLGTAHSVREKLRQGTEPTVAATHRRPGPESPAAGPAEPAVRMPAQVTTMLPRSACLNWSAISAKLAGDPTLRYTAGGRAFLRWMSLHAMQADEWREFIDAIPQRWAGEVARVAASMSDEWQEYSRTLQAREETAS
jgi:ParB-like chromosome segregation protein Spo0J